MKNLEIPSFWKKKFNLFFLFLIPLSGIYFILIQINKLKEIFSIKIKPKVICVGNIFLGGTGKTPLVIKIYNDLKNEKKCCILKKFRKNHMDEIKLLGENCKLFTSKKRNEGLKKAELEGYDIVIVDDGMQDYSFRKDISILCIKSKHGFGNGHLLPAGPLREPLSEINKYNIAVINGNYNEEINQILKKKNPSLKIYYSNYKISNIHELKGKKFIAFSGIADNESFFHLLKDSNLEIIETKEFGDHHEFTERELIYLIKKAEEKKVELITTEKNFKNISDGLKEKIHCAKLNLIINNNDDFLNEIY